MARKWAGGGGGGVDQAFMTNESVIECGDLRVVFRRRGDRYGHTIERRVDGAWRPLLESIEGSAEDAWPPSPTLQSLHIEQRLSGPVALLVGQAGSSHWSASVETDPSRSGLVYDVACRITQRADRIGTSYRTLQPDANSLISLAALSSDPSVSAGGQTDWTICPAQPRELPATTQWRYSIRAIA
jgi:hypothetical protein